MFILERLNENARYSMQLRALQVRLWEPSPQERGKNLRATLAITRAR
jgi:hypothetical protein